ncbi:uncharacterized protein TRIREDRAFT_35137, partial [Trichoderma reesei QM6a]
IVGSAAFNSYDESHNSTCLPGTRVELIQQILDWAGSKDGKPIFWLNGMLGTGKSTVSRTIAQSLYRAGRLGASFFFKRGHSDRQNAARFFTTIADQLARMQPAMADSIKDAARTDPSIGSKGVEEQFYQLILRPLSALPKENWKGKQVVIIVDALDECGQEDDATEILRLLSLAEPWLRVFVTSRPEFPIYQGFINIKGQVQDVAFNAIPRTMIKQDIKVLITYRLNEIRDRFNRTKQRRAPLDQSWPRQDHIDALAEMATPLFVYAAMMCNFIDDIRCGYPNSQLRKVLGWKAENSKTRPETKLDEAYLLLLNQLLASIAKEGRDTFLEEFRCIVGSIVLLGSPLPMPVLAKLLGLPFERVDITLNMLRSVLDIPPSDEAPVRPLHVSFGDFLVREAKKRHTFWIDEAKAHGAIAARCLHVMNQYFEPDLQPLGGEVSMMDCEEADASNEVQTAAVRYACLHWVFHLQGAKGGGHDVYGGALLFLEKHFLHWLEVLSEMHQVPESIKMLKTLQTLPQINDDKGKLSAFVGDALRILRANLQIIIDEPRQLYSSVILFAPDESIIKRLFVGSMCIQVSPKPRVESRWNHRMQILEGHTESVLCVAFSHDSLRVASASRDHTVRLWSIDTDEAVILKGHSRPVYAVVFSHDSLHVASGAGDSTVRVWRTESGQCIQTLDNSHKGRVMCMTFSHDALLLASASDDCSVKLWKTQGGDLIQEYADYPGVVTAIAFSHDASLMALASDDHTIRLHCTIAMKCVQEFHNPGSEVTSVAFSHNSSTIASASEDHSIQLWQVNLRGEHEQELGDHEGSVTSVTFSHDSKLLASTSGAWIRLWDFATGERIQAFDTGNSSISQLSFTCDDLSIVTNIGMFTRATNEGQFHVDGYGFTDGLSWITHKGDKRLWLPKDWRPTCSAVSSMSTLAIGCASGKVWIM